VPIVGLIEEAVNAVLVQEVKNEERSVYFGSRMLHVAQKRYQMIKNVAFSLVLTVKRMRPYFQSHHRSVVQIWLRQPSVAETKCLAITDVEVKTWMTLIVRYLEHDTCKLEEEKAMKQ